MTPERFDQLRSLSADAYVGGSRLAEALDEIARLADDVYVPGSWFCPTCGFAVVLNVLYAKSGNVGVDHRDPDPCPNDGTKLQPSTWKRDALEMSERMPDANCMSRIHSLRKSEGAAVTICSDNADFNGLPNCAIEVVDDWTDWVSKTFRANSLIEALADAETARAQYEKDHK